MKYKMIAVFTTTELETAYKHTYGEEICLYDELFYVDSSDIYTEYIYAPMPEDIQYNLEHYPEETVTVWRNLNKLIKNSLRGSGYHYKTILIVRGT